MPAVEWMKLESMIQQTCGIVSIVTNCFLIFLILTRSPPKLGTYKWLMLYTSLFELFYACINFFVGPSIDTHSSVCMAFQELDKAWLNHEVAYILVLVYCSCFGSSMALFAGHFIYRYGAVNPEFRQKHLSGTKQLILYICPIFCGIFWGITVWKYMPESKVKTDFMRGHMKQKFGLDIDECAYVALHFWPVDHKGNVYPDPLSFIGVVIMYIILGASFLSVAYFGANCYRYISQKLGNLANQSQAAKSLQVQLFYALIVQSAIPCALMYLPAATIFTCPMLNIGLDLKYPFVGVTIAIYPAIDPFPTILIIKYYRRRCIELLTCRKWKNQISDYSVNGADMSARPSAANINNIQPVATM